MSTRQHKHGTIYSSRHVRKKTRKTPPLPSKMHNHERSDEDYANLGPRHKLNHLRYPSGSGKRPPPKPKRLHAIQEVGSPSPPPNKIPVAAPRKKSPPKLATPPPKLATPPPKSSPPSKSPPRDQEDDWVKVDATPTLAPPRPLFPPKVSNKKPPQEDTPTPTAKRVPDKKRPPPKPQVKPTVSLDLDPTLDDDDDVEVTSLDILGVMRSQVKLNGVVTQPSSSQTSLPAPVPTQAIKPAKQPLLPPLVKPRRPKVKQSSESSLDVQSLQPRLPPSPTTPQRRSLAPPSPTQPQRKELWDQQREQPPKREQLPPQRDQLPPKPEQLPPQRDQLPPRQLPPKRDQLPPQRDQLPPKPEQLPPKKEQLPPKQLPPKQLPPKGEIPPKLEQSSKREKLPPLSIPPTSPQRKKVVTSPQRKPPPPPPHSPTSPSRRRQSLSESDGKVRSGKAPLPKPRPRKPSRGDDIDPPPQGNQQPANKDTEGVVSPRILPVARTRSADKLAAILVRRELSRDEEIVSSSPVHPGSAPRPNSCDKAVSLQIQSNGGQQKENMGGGRAPVKIPPVPRKRSKDALEPSRVQPEAKKPVSPQPATPSHQPAHQPSWRNRKKGGGIRMPLWKPPPPPSWTPPPTPTQYERYDKKKIQPLLPLSELTAPPLSPPLTPTGTTSFILPPFHSSNLSSPVPSSPDLERSWALDQEAPVVFSRPTCTSPTPKSPMTVEFEEKLFEFKTPRKGPGFQQQLPINVVQELQSNLRKQITRRSGMA